MGLQEESAELMAELAAEIGQQEQLVEGAQAELEACQAAAEAVAAQISTCKARLQVGLCSGE